MQEREMLMNGMKIEKVRKWKKKERMRDGGWNREFLEKKV